MDIVQKSLFEGIDDNNLSTTKTNKGMDTANNTSSSPHAPIQTPAQEPAQSTPQTPTNLPTSAPQNFTQGKGQTSEQRPRQKKRRRNKPKSQKQEKSEAGITQEVNPETNNFSVKKEGYGVKLQFRLSKPPMKLKKKSQSGLTKFFSAINWRLLGVILGTVGSAYCVEFAPAMSFIKAILIGISVTFFTLLVAFSVRMIKDWKVQSDGKSNNLYDKINDK